MRDNRELEKALRTLVREVIPTARFSGGFVYTADPAEEQLVPHLEIGSPELRSQRPVYLKFVEDHEDPVAQAFTGKRPVILTAIPEDSTFFAALAAPLGVSQRVGVFYLEMPHAVFSNDKKRHTVHFKALCQALNDCLKLG
jgi:hypothetical protein